MQDRPIRAEMRIFPANSHITGKSTQRPGRLTGFGSEAGYLRQSGRDDWALVGDAGFFKAPVTVHGLMDALRDAQILANCWARYRLEDYAPTRDALSHDLLRISDAIAGFNWTMDELLGLREDLNTAMKANQKWIADNLHSRQLAA